MKFSTVLAITLLIATVSAAPLSSCGGHNKSNKENNSINTDTSNSGNEEVDQSIGSVGSTYNSGPLSGILGGGVNILNESNTANNVGQTANVD